MLLAIKGSLATGRVGWFAREESIKRRSVAHGSGPNPACPVRFYNIVYVFRTRIEFQPDPCISERRLKSQIILKVSLCGYYLIVRQAEHFTYCCLS
jgi:hypothetical protein